MRGGAGAHAERLAAGADPGRAGRISELARLLAAHPAFADAVTLADVDGVSIQVVLTERDDLIAAARIARAQVTAERAKAQQGA